MVIRLLFCEYVEKLLVVIVFKNYYFRFFELVNIVILIVLNKRDCEILFNLIFVDVFFREVR